MTKSGRPKLVVIDGSQMGRRQLVALVEELRCFEVSAFDNVRDALVRITRDHPDLIICEWELPDVSGGELLNTLKDYESLSDIPVIVCTEIRNANLEVQVKKAGGNELLGKPVNRSLLRRYLEKLVPAITNGQEVLNDEHNVDIRSELAYIDKLAPLPSLVQIILEVANDPNSSARQISEVVKRDQSLTVKILQIVNSAYYGFYRQIGNIDHAVVILGFQEVVNITLAACLIQSYRNGKNPYFNREHFWIHSLGTAYIARALRVYTPDIIPQDAFVIGLLHDLGKVVLDQHFKKQFIEALSSADADGVALHKVEREKLEIDHAEIGGVVAEAWKLPVPLALAIRQHHEPNLAGSGNIQVHLAHLANALCHRQDIGASGNPAPDPFNPESLELFGFEEKDLDDVWLSLNIDAQSLKKIL